MHAAAAAAGLFLCAASALDGQKAMSVWEAFTWWPSLVMGWPAVVVGSLLYLAALAFRRPRLGLVAVVVWTPFCLYVSLYPRIQGLGLIALTGNVLSLVALWRGRIALACVGPILFILLAGFLAIRVLQQ